MKTTGFFGLFDILGYSKLNEINDLDTLIDIFNRNIITIDQFSFSEVKTILFSDTIILYEEKSAIEKINQGYIDPYQFMFKACTLLRLAFEGGVPLRGAVSYGEYYIHDRAFLGKPVIEAHNFESDQNWSGAALCKSAEKEYLMRLQRQSQKMPLIKSDAINPIIPYNFVSTNCLYKYPIPCKKSNVESFALCWDDSLLFMFGLKKQLPSIDRLNFDNKSKVYKIIREKFKAHDKPLGKTVAPMIKNTAEFIINTKDRLNG